MDYTEIRFNILELHGIVNANKEYKFYYDETNNPRIFKITEDGFNFDEKAFFVLGGIVFDKENIPNEENIEELYEKINVQKGMKEVKFRHIQQKSKNFLNLIRKPRVQKLIDWLYLNKLWIHYSYRDNFYYSIVDVVDTVEESFYGGPDFLREIKNILYLKMKDDKGSILDIFRRNDYPNIVDAPQFVMDILNWIEEVNEDENFLLEYFRQSIKGYRKKELELLKGKDSLITIDDYSDIYLNRIVTFLYSKHTFDEEEVIEKLIDNNIEIEGQLLDNYVFIDSKSSRFIQISDMIVGIIRMWLSYLENRELKEMITEFTQLSPEQIETLNKLNTIMNNSLKENFAFKHGSGSNEFERKISFFLDYDF